MHHRAMLTVGGTLQILLLLSSRHCSHSCCVVHAFAIAILVTDFLFIFVNAGRYTSELFLSFTVLALRWCSDVLSKVYQWGPRCHHKMTLKHFANHSPNFYRESKSAKFGLDFPHQSPLKLIHCVSKKGPTCKRSVTLSNLNRFSKFLHYWKAYKLSLIHIWRCRRRG